ncbi:MAG: phosphatase PAP2 family protein [Flavobacteriales bacterium]|nr:phosphatase PAP2 family protein [Flavobacteriales bacterium]
MRRGCVLAAIVCALLIGRGSGCHAQSPYELDVGRELLLVGGGVGSNIASFLVPVDPDRLFQQAISRPITSIPAIDRSAARKWSPRAHKASNYLFVGALTASFTGSALVYPKEPGVPLTIVGESFLISSGLTGVVKALVQRPRPYVYNDDVPDHIRHERDAFLSFWSGHAANTAALSISSAMLIDRAEVDRTVRACAWVGAIALPALMAWLRVRAGRHFPTDVLAGCLVGGLTGLLVPYIHRPNSQSQP